MQSWSISSLSDSVSPFVGNTSGTSICSKLLLLVIVFSSSKVKFCHSNICRQMAGGSRLMIGKREYPSEVGCQGWGWDYAYKAGAGMGEWWKRTLHIPTLMPWNHNHYWCLIHVGYSVICHKIQGRQGAMQIANANYVSFVFPKWLDLQLQLPDRVHNALLFLL